MYMYMYIDLHTKDNRGPYIHLRVIYTEGTLKTSFVTGHTKVVVMAVMIEHTD